MATSLALTPDDLAAAALLAGLSGAVIAFGLSRWTPAIRVDDLRREARVRPALRRLPQAANGRGTRVDRGPLTIPFERMRALRLHAPGGRPQVLCLVLTDGAEVPIWATLGRPDRDRLEALRMQLPPELPLVGPAETPGPREMQPPWIRWPGALPEWSGFRQGYGEAWYLLHFQPFWSKLGPDDRLAWLDRWEAPAAWRNRLE
jgi:hypothetical protein